MHQKNVSECGRVSFGLFCFQNQLHFRPQRRPLLTVDQLVLNRTLQKEKPEESVAMGIVDVPGGQQEKYVSPGRTAFLS